MPSILTLTPLHLKIYSAKYLYQTNYVLYIKILRNDCSFRNNVRNIFSYPLNLFIFLLFHSFCHIFGTTQLFFFFFKCRAKSSIFIRHAFMSLFGIWGCVLALLSRNLSNQRYPLPKNITIWFHDVTVVVSADR